ncbi:hypothetical protein QL285_044247 [Trifolium repens]|nr:hypothetical protein QL285_044247 [Trifolium repens]
MKNNIPSQHHSTFGISINILKPVRDVVILARCNSPSSNILGGSDTVTLRSSLLPLLVEFLSFVRIESCTLAFKYMFNPFSLPIELRKNSTSEGVEKIMRW